jgi:hypothetical protein
MKTNPRARMLLPAASSGLTSLLLAIAFTFQQGTAQYALLLLVGVTIIMFVPAAVAVTQDLVHPGLRATSLSLNIVIQHTLGSPLGPLFVGRISDSHGIETAMQLLPAFTLLAAVLFFAGAFYYPRDAARVAKIDLIIDQ